MAGGAPRGSGGDHERPDADGPAGARRTRRAAPGSIRSASWRIAPSGPSTRSSDSSRPGPSPARPEDHEVAHDRASRPRRAGSSSSAPRPRPRPRPAARPRAPAARRRRRSRRAPARSAPAPGSATVAAIGSTSSVPLSTTISTRSWSPASGPACERSSVTRPGPSTRGAIRSPRASSSTRPPTRPAAQGGQTPQHSIWLCAWVRDVRG